MNKTLKLTKIFIMVLSNCLTISYIEQCLVKNYCLEWSLEVQGCRAAMQRMRQNGCTSKASVAKEWVHTQPAQLSETLSKNKKGEIKLRQSSMVKHLPSMYKMLG